MSTSQALPRDEPKLDQPQDPFSPNDLFDFNVTGIQDPEQVGVDEPVVSEVAVDPDPTADDDDDDDLREPIAVPEVDHIPEDLHIQEQHTSPKPDGSSSLSPPPTDDAVASPIPTETVEEQFPVATDETEDSGDGKTEEPVVVIELEVEEEKIGSPLSELSPAPEQEEHEPVQQNGEEELGTGGSAPEEITKAEKEGKVEEVSMKPSVPKSVPTQSTNTLTLPSATNLNPSPPQRISIERSSSTPAPAKSPSTSSVPEKETRSASRQPSVSRPTSSTPTPPSMDKGVRLLELNAELLK